MLNFFRARRFRCIESIKFGDKAKSRHVAVSMDIRFKLEYNV